MNSDPSVISIVFWGIITFSLLIVIHEGGHFLAARAFGVKVHEFMIGLPGPALRFRGKKTTYGVTAIPLGGYVRIAGMEPGPEDPLLQPVLALVTRDETGDATGVAEALGVAEDEAATALFTLADWDALTAPAGEDGVYRSKFAPVDADDPKLLLERARSVTFRGLSFPKRVMVLSMGVVLNLLTAILVFTVVLTAMGFDHPTMNIDTVGSGSAAEAAGIRSGDVILAVNGTKTDSWDRLVRTIQTYQPGETVTVTISRNGYVSEVAARLKPATDSVSGNPITPSRAMLGVTQGYRSVPAGHPIAAFGESFYYLGLTFSALAGLFTPSRFQSTVSQSSSIVGASVMLAEAWRQGVLTYTTLVAALSLSLGAINIFPIPPLDGGKIVVEIIERVRGRSLSRGFSLGVSLTGAALLFALIGYLMYADVVRLASG